MLFAFQTTVVGYVCALVLIVIIDIFFLSKTPWVESLLSEIVQALVCILVGWTFRLRRFPEYGEPANDTSSEETGTGVHDRSPKTVLIVGPTRTDTDSYLATKFNGAANKRKKKNSAKKRQDDVASGGSVSPLGNEITLSLGNVRQTREQGLNDDDGSVSSSSSGISDPSVAMLTPEFRTEKDLEMNELEEREVTLPNSVGL
eukprot:TRINITY_DN1601_c0_g1_i2.p1 TRINITY_DN1601_c0_g1~~TRINITY_DN1601_c0_g1_i2.p1  ORF type:complete len:202 (+),score=67.72 TRINITY_DN1601_c0_g1_i2:112-717(+)